MSAKDLDTASEKAASHDGHLASEDRVGDGTFIFW